MSSGTLLRRTARCLGRAPTVAAVLARAGVLRPYPPHRLAQAALALARWGAGPAGGFAALALLVPERTAVVDDLGALTYGELHDRSNRLADSLAARGVGPGDGVAVMCRNHRGFVDVSLAAAKLGADLVHVNTAFAGPQLRQVLERETPAVVVLDQEFAGLLPDLVARPLDGGTPLEPVLGWVDDPVAAGTAPTLERLVAEGRPGERRAPCRGGRVVILTSGTTGSPRGAPRGGAGLEVATSLLSGLPLRSGWRCHVAAPLFHAWGWAHLSLSMLLGSTLVLTRRFTPEDCLRLVAEQRCESLVVVPVMLQRIMALPAPTLASYDLTRLRLVATSGSALPGDLAERWMDEFGDHLYNVYGSTEVGFATVAGPADLRAAPGTAGRPPFATVVRILGGDGREAPRGQVGRIFVGNGFLFEGYTGGGAGDVVDGLMATGDLGRLDPAGRLVVEGREDEMVVSGGENVFPAVVEDALARHPGVHEAAVVGVRDDEWGQRLRAFVVLAEGVAVTPDDLVEHARRRLARFEVPREVVLVDDLPRNATGKVVKGELARD